MQLVPGLGAHRLDRLEPEHLERFYQKMQSNGSAAGIAHHVHHTVRTALSEAVRRGHVPSDAAEIAKAPRLEVHWEDVDLASRYVRIRKNRLRPKYVHDCGANPCGRKAGYCPKREQTRRERKSTKSRAGRRTIGLPDPLIKILRQHQEAQERERITAGTDWEDKGHVFASAIGGPLSPNTDFHTRKQLLRDAGVRNGRLHDARHTAATVLLILGVPDVVIGSVMGWEPGEAARMRARYMHVTGTMLRKVAQQAGDALREPHRAD